ncbi:hypothetical protein BT96DRAFT_998598 [Gymnopus androsaceus JB14]|uniref:Uncharacterized protein n=1 Tax=Gymnopus androsaceus JB14 TaxID=1447944 RepID=A0A6A4HAQ7_9AGAR|nr:hypothetical protein BT96DRAFT_998598 [Gymnopus androsaceus JB14]
MAGAGDTPRSSLGIDSLVGPVDIFGASASSDALEAAGSMNRRQQDRKCVAAFLPMFITLSSIFSLRASSFLTAGFTD